MITKITQIDRDYGFDENDIIESNESFMAAMKKIEYEDELLVNSANQTKLNEVASQLECLAQAIRDGNLDAFLDLTFDSNSAYCQGEGILPNIDLDEVHDILARAADSSGHYN